MIRINQMKLNIEHTSDDFERKILKTLCIKKEELQGFQICKQSIDAKKKACSLLCLFCRCPGKR